MALEFLQNEIAHTSCHPLQRLNKKRWTLRLIGLVKGVATFLLAPCKRCLALSWNMIHNILLQCNYSTAFLAAVCRNSLFPFIWRCFFLRGNLCRYTRICPKFRTVYLLSTVVKLTWKHGEINPSQKIFKTITDSTYLIILFVTGKNMFPTDMKDRSIIMLKFKDENLIG